jgi:hypothetical protein
MDITILTIVILIKEGVAFVLQANIEQLIEVAEIS